ncbi:RDD family protein [Catenuloplanes niger JCM 9533]|uniref:RDD family membrane protein YckC n=1 Tax=Catenuloplanes niger TaxID=587534 RepID=A0AAE3ZPX0_9ACTN|nr:putative RDD family membrane protein YckC [Catenuloplanes niger]
MAANPVNKQRKSNDPPNGEIELPTLGRRFGALAIDWALCLLVANLYGEPTRDGWSPVVALIFIYTVFAGFFAQTPGMALTRIAVVDVDRGGPIGPLRGLLRGLLICLVLPMLVLDGRRRGLHDRLARSIVLPAPKKNP